MSENEVIAIASIVKRELKEDISEIKERIKELTNAFNDYREKIPQKYVPKNEYEAFEKENNGAHKQIIGWIIGLFTFIFVAAAVVISIVR